MMEIDSGSQPTEQVQPMAKTSMKDIIYVNTGFSNNRLRITLSAPIMEEVAKKEKVEGNREMAVDSTVVRIMKTHKKLMYTDLMQETMKGLHMFKPQPKFIKLCIEKLITKDYLKRDESDKACLHYVA